MGYAVKYEEQRECLPAALMGDGESLHLDVGGQELSQALSKVRHGSDR